MSLIFPIEIWTREILPKYLYQPGQENYTNLKNFYLLMALKKVNKWFFAEIIVPFAFKTLLKTPTVEIKGCKNPFTVTLSNAQSLYFRKHVKVLQTKKVCKSAAFEHFPVLVDYPHELMRLPYGTMQRTAGPGFAYLFSILHVARRSILVLKMKIGATLKAEERIRRIHNLCTLVGKERPLLSEAKGLLTNKRPWNLIKKELKSYIGAGYSTDYLEIAKIILTEPLFDQIVTSVGELYFKDQGDTFQDYEIEFLRQLYNRSNWIGTSEEEAIEIVRKEYPSLSNLTCSKALGFKKYTLLKSFLDKNLRIQSLKSQKFEIIAMEAGIKRVDGKSGSKKARQARVDFILKDSSTANETVEAVLLFLTAGQRTKLNKTKLVKFADQVLDENFEIVEAED